MYLTGMTKTPKIKVEVLLVEPIHQQFEAVCAAKGISIADGLRRAIELWIKEEK